ncbi:MAG: hypothetical protein ACRESZ_09050, partial [Methylococcales bacterium]
TWMVTNIRDWTVAGQTHPLFSVQNHQPVSDLHTDTDTQLHQPHCGVCSYDHGGHTGQTIEAVSFVAANIPAQSLINSFNPDFCHARRPTPELRPPIP